MEAVIAEPSRGAAQGETTELSVSGMTCNNCVRHATEALQGVPGVRAVNAELETGSAKVRWSAGQQVKVDALVSALDEAGYKATLKDAQKPAGRWAKWSPLSGWQFN